MPLKVYFLDDEPELLELFQEIFSTPDIAVFVFSDPSEACEKIRRDPPDVFFVDYVLPNVTGDKIAESLDPRICKVLLSGEYDHQSTAHFDAVFSKPFPIDSIKEFLEKRLERTSSSS